MPMRRFEGSPLEVRITPFWSSLALICLIVDVIRLIHIFPFCFLVLNATYKRQLGVEGEPWTLGSLPGWRCEFWWILLSTWELFPWRRVIEPYSGVEKSKGNPFLVLGAVKSHLYMFLCNRPRSLKRWLLFEELEVKDSRLFIFLGIIGCNELHAFAHSVCMTESSLILEKLLHH